MFFLITLIINYLLWSKKQKNEILSSVFISPDHSLFLKGSLSNRLKIASDLSSKIQLTLLWSLLLVLLFQFLVRLKALGSLSIPSLKCLKIPLDTPVDWLIKYAKISLPLLTVSLIMFSKLNDFVRVGERKSRFFDMIETSLYSTLVLINVNFLSLIA